MGKEDADTQKPAPSELFFEPSIQEEEGKPEIEVILDMNWEVLTVTPEPSQDTELIEESQQQQDIEVNQDVATQEPTFSEILVGTPF